MAESITRTLSLTVGADVLMRGYYTETSTQAGNENYAGTQSIATSATAINLGGVSTIGGLFIKNEDATNYVEIDSANTFDKFPQKILPGEAIFLAPQTVTIYGKANTGAVNIRVVAVEL